MNILRTWVDPETKEEKEYGNENAVPFYNKYVLDGYIYNRVNK